MEYFFFKILGLLFSPLVIIFILLACGWLLLLFKKRAASFFITCGMIVFIAGGLFPTGYNLMVCLERQYTQEPEIKPYLNGIVILGGTFKTEQSSVLDRVIINDNVERVLDGLRLHREHPESLVIFSGGNGILGGNKKPESKEVQRFLDGMGLDDGYMLYEEKSRNTYENAAFTHELIQPLPSETWLLVTSAYHMPRAMAVFRSHSWDVTAYPTDYRTDLRYEFMPSLKNMPRNLSMLDLALHEIVGRFLYKLTGKITSAKTNGYIKGDIQ